MPWRKLLKITSKWHALAVSFYVFQFGLGLVFTLSTENSIRYIVQTSEAHGETLGRLWAVLVLAGGVLAIVSMFFKEIEDYLILEFCGSTCIAAMMGWLFVAMMLAGTASMLGVFIVGFLTVGPLARSGQIVYEKWIVGRAKKNPLLATSEEYLAAPTDK